MVRSCDGQAWTYVYDDLDRLISADNLGDNTMDQSFTWSIAGNLTSNSALGTYSYPAPTAARPHAPTSVGAQSFTCDAARSSMAGAKRLLRGPAHTPSHTRLKPLFLENRLIAMP